MNKSDFLQLMIDYLSINPDKRKDLYKELMALTQINYSSEAPQITPITQDDIDNSTTLIQQIANRIDWSMLEDTEFGEDEFFNGEKGLYTSLKKALASLNGYKNDYTKITDDTEIWQDFWNDSVASLMKLLAEKIDPESVRDYERSGLLIEVTEPPEDEGMIDTEHLRASIAAHGAVAELRMIDIMDADAGYSFADANEVYEYLRFYSYVKVTKGNNSYEGKNVLFGEEANKYFGPLEANPTKLNSSQAQEFSSSVRSGVEFNNEDEEYIIPAQGGTYSITGTYKIFKVVKKPWVIPWYNVDGETYSRVRGSDKKLSVLCDEKKLGFTRTQGRNKWIRLIMPQYQRKVEVEDLNRDFWVIGQVLAGISIYLFDEDSPLNKMIKGLLKEIGELWENVAFLWAALALLGQHKAYDKTHSEVVLLNSENFSKRIDFDNFNISTSITDAAVTAQLEYLIDQYSDQNLIIVPYIRSNNYEKNYYETVYFPGIWVYDRNSDNPQWEIFTLYKDNLYTKPLEISLSEFKDYIYGIQELEEIYNYIGPLSNANMAQTYQGDRFYGLVRDYIKFANTTITPDQRNIKVKIELKDIGRNLVTKFGSKTIFSAIYTIMAGSSTATISNLQTISSFPDVPETSIFTKNIEKGYYQGELLSCYQDSTLMNRAIKIKYIELPPEFAGTKTDESIRTSPHNLKSAKINHANEILKQYFQQKIFNKAGYDNDCIYILIGHFHYTKGDAYNGTAGNFSYWDLDGNNNLVSAAITTVKDENNQDIQAKRSGEGVDTGLVLFLPGQNVARYEESVNNQNGMWAYSDFKTANDAEAAGKQRMSSAYRVDLFLKRGDTARREDNWLIRYTTMAINGLNKDCTVAAEHCDGHVIFEHPWQHDSENGYYYYHCVERTFSYYIKLVKENNLLKLKMNQIVRERNGIDNPDGYSLAALDDSFSGGAESAQEYSYLDPYNPNYTVVDVEIQGVADKKQELGINTFNPPNNKGNTVYPNYIQYPNDGYTK